MFDRDMRDAKPLRVLSLYYSFAPGGASTYGSLLSRVEECAPIVLRHLCILSPNWRCDATVLARLKAIEIHTKSRLNLGWLDEAAARIQAFQPDLLMTHGHNGHAAALMLRYACGVHIPAAASYHGPYFGSSLTRKLAAPAYNLLTDSFLHYRTIGVASVSAFSKRCLVDHGVPADSITVIHNGLETRAVQPGSTRGRLRSEWGVAATDLVVGTVARLEPIKGVQVLIEAYAGLARVQADVRLAIVGSGPYEDTLKALARRCGFTGSIIFTGHRTDVEACLEAFDVFVLPSLSENHSIALLEAMRAGKAIIATNVGGNTESVRDGREALVVDADDAGALRDALMALSGDQSLRLALGRAATARFRSNFMVEEMIRRTADWLMACGERALASV